MNTLYCQTFYKNLLIMVHTQSLISQILKRCCPLNALATRTLKNIGSQSVSKMFSYSSLVNVQKCSLSGSDYVVGTTLNQVRGVLLNLKYWPYSMFQGMWLGRRKSNLHIERSWRPSDNCSFLLWWSFFCYWWSRQKGKDKCTKANLIVHYVIK